ncbi:hypothetical protein [Microbaculum marinum]|uniref:ASCH domain-containing protein n=1 Tax=Microbaculum marinum TaxID=1764581 RepID=A0AAW9RYM4_9HYPH
MTTLDAIRSGDVTLAFRRWQRATVKAGTEQRTKIGLVRILSIEEIAEADITEADARRAGSSSRAALLGELDGRDGTLYRISLEYGGPDPRIALRQDADLSDGDIAAIAARLDRMDRASDGGPWTRETLHLIADKPGTRAIELARSMGLEKKYFKTRVRRLKELGLTESLDIGYRLSPRGRAALKALSDRS